jgi:hypothetical protein
MKGPEGFKQFSEDWSIPLLVLVGSYEAVDEEALRTSGFKHILKKPFGSGDVVKAAGEVLGQDIPLPGASAPSSAPTSTAAMPPPPPVPPPPAFNLAHPPPRPSQAPSFAVSLSDMDTDGRGGRPATAASMPVPPPPPPPSSLPPISATPSPPAFSTPPNLTDESRRGRRAFDDDASSGSGAALRSAPPAPPPPPPSLSIASTVGDQIKSDVLNEMQGKGFSPPPAPPLGVASPPGVLRPPPPAASAAVVSSSIGFAATKEDMLQAIREAVEEYCSKHFPAVAREVITAEIRRLSEERSRHV